MTNQFTFHRGKIYREELRECFDFSQTIKVVRIIIDLLHLQVKKEVTD